MPSDNTQDSNAPIPQPQPEPSPGAPTPDPSQSVQDPPSGGPEPAQGGGQPEPAPARAPDSWKDRRISELTAKLRNTQAELAQARTGGQPQEPGASPPPPPQPQLDESEVNRRASLMARDLSARQEFDRSCNETATAGRLAFPDFDSRVNSLRGLVNPNDPSEASSYNTFLTAAIDTGEGAKVLHTLGGDLNEAQRIMSLSPTKMAAELTRLALRGIDDGGTVSGTPRPIRPVQGGRQASHSQIAPDDPERADGLSSAEWFARRNAQVSKRANGAA